VGLHLKNIYNLRPDSQTFSADGWYWLEWSEPLNRILIAKELKPVQMVEFFNQVETWDSQIEAETAETAEPMLLPMAVAISCTAFPHAFISMPSMGAIPRSRPWCCQWWRRPDRSRSP
jgi:hypothetical protein